MFNTGRLIKENTMAESKNPALSMVHLHGLRFIAEKKNPTMRELADFFGVTAPTATSLTNLLIKNKQVRRVSDKKDRRIIRLQITSSGQKNIETGSQEICERMKKVFDKLSQEEINQLIKILEKVYSYHQET
jgi:DNA-binding MarR family transcriptional regulator